MSSHTALVTGGARGMGAEIAYRLAEDGFAVAVSDVRDCEPVASGMLADISALSHYVSADAPLFCRRVTVARERDSGSVSSARARTLRPPR